MKTTSPWLVCGLALAAVMASDARRAEAQYVTGLTVTEQRNAAPLLRQGFRRVFGDSGGSVGDFAAKTTLVKTLPSYSVIDRDLNKGAGGRYIFLHVRKGNGSVHRPISQIKIIKGRNANPGKGWYKVNVDLNRGAGGSYLWLCYKHWEKAGDPKVMFVFVFGNNNRAKALTDRWLPVLRTKQPAFGTTYRDNTGFGYLCNVDLNEGAGGEYIYLSYIASSKH